MRLILFVLLLLPLSVTYADENVLQEGRYATNYRYCGFHLMYDPSGSGIIIVYGDNAYNGVLCTLPGLTQQWYFVSDQGYYRFNVPDSNLEDEVDDSYYCIIKSVSSTRLTMACYWNSNGSVISAVQYFRY